MAPPLQPAHTGDDGAQCCECDENEGDCDNCRHGEAPLWYVSRTGRSGIKERVSALARRIKSPLRRPAEWPLRARNRLRRPHSE